MRIHAVLQIQHFSFSEATKEGPLAESISNEVNLRYKLKATWHASWDEDGQYEKKNFDILVAAQIHTHTMLSYLSLLLHFREHAVNQTSHSLYIDIWCTKSKCNKHLSFGTEFILLGTINLSMGLMIKSLQ